MAVAATVAYLALGAAPAAAHVEVAGAQPNGDGTTTLTFSFDHSCDGSPTTELVVALPDAVTATATVTPGGWSGAVTDRRVTFTGPGLETAQVGVTTRITAQAGDTLIFPVLQRCADGGSYDWIDITADSEHPAPRLIATNAVLAAQPDTTAAPTPAAAGRPVQEQGGGATLSQTLAVLAAFVLAAATTGFVLARRA
ncbi:DUF1775 domain-containing protein [Micromonospora sp. WMMD1082]|uniref:DUF1775 domain-containing protein n=1 Tax=Micromonospora sp. WMMD1082 TaxID=3016104 RepID=UPI00241720D8|nr:DUF1775 domain-containing protein [Micromonospora sp. WMMD1082]MDG4795673.1 DUF1775 domain-containing protein [Micromonospora sp. WMMD1082]